MPLTYRTDLPLLFKEGVARNLVDVGRLSEPECEVWLSRTSTSKRSCSRTKRVGRLLSICRRAGRFMIGGWKGLSGLEGQAKRVCVSEDESHGRSTVFKFHPGRARLAPAKSR